MTDLENCTCGGKGVARGWHGRAVGGGIYMNRVQPHQLDLWQERSHVSPVYLHQFLSLSIAVPLGSSSLTFSLPDPPPVFLSFPDVFPLWVCHPLSPFSRSCLPFCSLFPFLSISSSAQSSAFFFAKAGNICAFALPLLVFKMWLISYNQIHKQWVIFRSLLKYFRSGCRLFVWVFMCSD